MPLDVRDSAGQRVLHHNSYVASDFHSPELVEAARDLDLPTGKGYMAHWYFGGIRLAYARWHYRQPHATEWRADLDVVHLHVCLRGRLRIENRRSGTVTLLRSSECNLWYYPSFEGVLHSDELEEETFIMQFTRPVFQALAGGVPELRRFGEAVAQGRGQLLSEQPLPVGLAAHTAIREVLACRLPAPLKQLLLHGKALELLALQAQALTQVDHPRRFARTDYDQERLLFARDYLLQHAALPPSLPELARLAGLNEFKLKNGFKELFGLPVFGYLAEYRLAEAKARLLQGRQTVSEIAFELGYSSSQHFSAAFKKRFGVSPTQLR